MKRPRSWLIAAAVLLVLAVVGVLAQSGGSDDREPETSGADRDPITIGSGGEPSASIGTPTSTATDAESTVRPGDTPRATRTPTPRGATPAPTMPPTPTITPTPVPGPHLAIPAIGVFAHVETRSTDSNNVMQTPTDPWNIAWYDFTARPGAGGNAVFAGHVDHVTAGKVVFFRLRELKVGDEIEYRALDGSVVRYRVTRSFRVAADAAANDYVAPRSVDMITLITCDGDFDRGTLSYDERLVVQGERVS